MEVEVTGGGTLKEHEKFWAFAMLGGSVLLIAMMAYFYPPQDGSGAQRIIDAAMGGLLLALGSAANALFRISNATEQQAIGRETAKAMSERPPMETKIVNTEAQPIPTTESTKDKTPSDDELPEEQKL